MDCVQECAELSMQNYGHSWQPYQQQMMVGLLSHTVNKNSEGSQNCHQLWDGFQCIQKYDGHLHHLPNRLYHVHVHVLYLVFHLLHFPNHHLLHFLNHHLLDFLNHHLLHFPNHHLLHFPNHHPKLQLLHLLNYFPNHHQLLLLYYLQNIIHDVNMNDQNSFISLIPAKHLLFTEETKSTSCSSQRALNLTMKSGEGCPLLKITCIYVFLCTVSFDVVIVQS